MADNLQVVMGNETLDVSEKFYRNLNKEISLQGRTTGNEMELDWINVISDAVPYIDNIFDSPRRFIVGQEEVLNIEKSKKVTVESIKHLSKHSNFISEYNEEKNEVKPSKLLNVLKEETFNTYENRFIYTLVDLLESFVRRMEEKMDDTFLGKSEKFFVNANSMVDKEDVKMEIKMVTNKDANARTLNEDYSIKIDSIKSRLASWKNSVLYVSLKKEGASKVTNPLKRTNVLLKNPNFKVAASLWDFLHGYEEKINALNEKDDTYSKLAPELQKLLDNSLLMYYIISKMGSATSKYDYDKYRKYIKSAVSDIMTNATEVFMDEMDLQNQGLNGSGNGGKGEEDGSGAVEHKDKKGVDKKAVSIKIESMIKKFTDKVDNSYFTTINDKDDDEEEENEKDI